MLFPRSLQQERGQNYALKEQVVVLEEAHTRLQDECRHMQLEHASSEKLQEAKSSVRQLSQQMVALKWQLLEAMRRAELAEAACARQGITPVL
jgi:Rad3-related DNA helicase